jgi:hypothetical protein
MTLDGCYGSWVGTPDAAEKIEKATQLSQKLNHHFPLFMVYSWSYEYYRQQGRMDIVEKHLELAKQVAQQNNNLYFLGTLYILRFSLAVLNPDTDYEKTAAEALEFYGIMPERGYKGMKAGAMGCYTYCLIKLGRLDEAEAPGMKALEYSRVCGEKDSEFYSALGTCWWFSLQGKHEKACKIMGAVDAFIEAFNYPLVGAGKVQYNEARSQVFKDNGSPQHQRWYEEGKKMSLPDAVVYALKG